MDLSLALGNFLFFLWMSGICTGENCTDFKLVSVPGEVAMLKSSLLSSDVLQCRTVPYNITWMNSKTGQEMSNQTGQILVLGATLWFLNTTLDDAGKYVIILRAPSQCYKESFELVVDRAAAGECGKPNKIKQELINGVSDLLNCPLENYINTLKSYNISSRLKWYNKCVLIPDGRNEYTYMRETILRITSTRTEHSGIYTCTLTFPLDGVTRSVSETIEATVKEEYSWIPQVHKPANEDVKAKKGSNFIRGCLVFVPGGEKPSEIVFWTFKNNFDLGTHPSARIYMSEQRMWRQDKPTGWFIEKLLIFSELKEEDFHINYTCRVRSPWGKFSGYFTLLAEDLDNTLLITLGLGSVIVLCVISAIVYYICKIDIVLCFRRTFSVFYTNKDGKLYDAYVTYPQPDTVGFSEEVEKFALQTLPEVLEKACGYKLFIAGRDCLPGQAIVDSVDENIKSSRRVLLLYTASTFISHRDTSSTSSNNNNVSKNNDNKTEEQSSDSSSMGLDGGDKVFSDTRQQLECVTAMHRALLEGSLKVVLVELEEITPTQLALFPESVRHLRKKQGAVCWWKNLQKTQRRGTRVRWRQDGEKHGEDSSLSPSLCPSSRFWKEMRYHMPVRGKRVVSAEKTTLLNL